MTITDLSSDTWKFDLDEPDDLSVAFIAQYYRVHIGDLNNLINQGFYISDTYEIVDENGNEIDVDAVSIYKKLFEIYYFRKQSKTYLGAGGVDSVVSVTQDGTTFRGVERNGIAKTYNDLLKESKNDLKNLVNNYKFNRSTARQVVGDDFLGDDCVRVVDPRNGNSSY